ncbi:hypothetical protein SERLA73DRAFT_175377 [Serpula lacrymans var. lacrymans S7.3]|uniref:Uncharacterized protein n=2 Tax=Serpula lacrymans var. lacrymans TaxID=341189 RepID=F8PJC9_SERL3|nr:uncharacterized protein SERLADRAFT_457616 [Serpula lacrymans var. lacrymans S7.9]EGO03754.1 hypothetical protein SERLA73DRAFT_175377 [Serpula lacrymans var. lacrymans S7.3]EGO29621.1 hypothetical protein SERLADRAFT_457616 [Serpula lacrymans var. lacrymans S7.9]
MSSSWVIGGIRQPMTGPVIIHSHCIRVRVAKTVDMTRIGWEIRNCVLWGSSLWPRFPQRSKAWLLQYTWVLWVRGYDRLNMVVFEGHGGIGFVYLSNSCDKYGTVAPDIGRTANRTTRDDGIEYFDVISIEKPLVGRLHLGLFIALSYKRPCFVVILAAEHL